LNGWGDFGHEDTAVTRNDRMRTRTNWRACSPADHRNCRPGSAFSGQHRADTPAIADADVEQGRRSDRDPLDRQGESRARGAIVDRDGATARRTSYA
jgi:hypothetical protein